MAVEASSRSNNAPTFLRYLSICGILITGVSSVFLNATTSFQLPWLTIAIVVGTNIIVLTLLRFKQDRLAIHVFALAAFAILIHQSLTSYEVFLLATAGFVSLVLTLLVVYPGRQWMFAIAGATAFLIGANIWFVQMLDSPAERALRIDSAIWQMTVFVVSSSAIIFAFQSIVRASLQREAALAALSRSEALANKRSDELKASYTALQQSEARYRRMIEDAHEAILLCSYPSMDLIGVNEAACDLFKYTRDELQSMNGLDLSASLPTTVTGDVLSMDEAELTLERGDLLAFEQVHVDKNGREFLCHVRMVLVSGKSRKLRVTLADVDEQRAIERRERDLNERLQLISNNIPVRIAYLDAALDVQFWNKSFGDVFKLGDKQPPLSASETFGPHLSKEYHRYFVDALAGGRPQFESLGMGSDGRVRTGRVTFIPHEVDGIVVGIFAAAVDISAEREAQHRLAETSEFLQLITDNIPARLSYTTLDGTLRFLNREYEVYGVDRDEAIGNSAQTHLPPEMNLDIQKVVEQIKRGERVTMERKVVTQDGTERIESILAVPHLIEDETQGYILLVSDVTQLRRAEQAFQQAQKVESLGVLAGGIAHDFNNLLVAILGQNTLASAKLDAKHPAKQHIEKAVQASQRAASLTNQMLAYSGRGAFAIAPIHLNMLIDENLDLFRVSVPQTIEFTTKFADPLPVMSGDSAQMQQIIMNLIINAGQAIGDRVGYIKVATHAVDLTAKDIDSLQLVGGTLNSGSYVVVSIEDNGCGMDAETQQSIFDPFFSTKESGSGLGLAAVLGIVRGHSGGIVCQSVPGYGTIFQLYFPAVAQNQVKDNHKPEQVVIPSDDLRTVLIIDDNPSVTVVIEDILEMEGVRTITYHDPLEGIDCFRSKVDEIDLVILDVMMPNMNGTEVLQVLRDIDPSVYVLLSSGYSREDIVSRFLDSGTDFIQKPYDYQQLVRQVYAAFEREPLPA